MQKPGAAGPPPTDGTTGGKAAYSHPPHGGDCKGENKKWLR
ncbi:MAG: hypothetical protein Q8N13_05985 [Acidovorax sp.]|nr:hypothetical protein [Acidovorax sp.]